MQRARSDDEKQQRKEVFLEVGEKLFLKKPDSLPSVTAIVKAASLAKGTFYLYFATKEELYLDILSIRFSAWLTAIREQLEKKPDLKAQFLAEVILAPVRDDACFLQLAAITPTILEVNLSPERAITFKKGLGSELSELAGWMEESFNIPKDQVIDMLQSCYAIVLGCWQVSRVSDTVAAIKDKVGYDFLFPSFTEKAKPLLENVMRAYLSQINSK